MPTWPRTAAMAAIKTSPTKNQVIALSVTLSTDKVRLRDMLRDMGRFPAAPIHTH